MSRELQELRNRQGGDGSATRSESAFGSTTSTDHVIEDAEDDFELKKGVVSLNGTLVEPELVVSTFKESAALDEF